VTPLSSSVRTVAARDSLAAARTAARRVGITRCADVTHLDRIGIPVFMSTRPAAQYVCVTAGKGATVDEAQMGALMEGIEQATAERPPPAADVAALSPQRVRAEWSLTVDAFCPRPGTRLDAGAPMGWVWAEDLLTPGHVAPVPAELITIPCPAPLSAGLYGSTTNGLASGNDVAEATLHGLCEVLERDVSSFNLVHDRSRHVPLTGLPDALDALVTQVHDAGLQLLLRFTPNPVGLAYFSCLVFDPLDDAPVRNNAGYGLHPVAEIAATRAICEAVQSRCSFIQGGREDLEPVYAAAAERSESENKQHTQILRARYASKDRTTTFAAVPSIDHEGEVGSLLDEVLTRCRAAGFPRVLRYRYRSAPDPFSVVRVVVPLAEHFTGSTMRIGPRLLGEHRRQELSTDLATARPR